MSQISNARLSIACGIFQIKIATKKLIFSKGTIIFDNDNNVV